jgi:hypothetical protein
MGHVNILGTILIYMLLEYIGGHEAKYLKIKGLTS